MSSPSHIPPGPPADDASRADIGIVCALPMECAPLLERCQHVRKYSGGRFVFRGGRLDDVRIVVVETGPGASLAARGTRALIDAHRPDWVISAGFSGALTESVQRNHIVVGTAIRAADARELAFDLTFQGDAAAGQHAGRLLNADRIIRTVEEKRTLGEETGCLAVDLESFAVADVCREQSQKFLAIRVISDDFEADLPPEAVAIFSTSGVKRWGAVAGSLWNRPSSAQDLLQLRDQAHAAAESLAKFLIEMIDQLKPRS